MNRPTLFSSALLALSFALSSCGGGAASASPPAPAPSTGSSPAPTPGTGTASYLTGKVTDLQGRPLEGAKIDADNTLEYNSDLIAYSKADGTYSIDLGVYPVTWNVTAYLDLDYNGWKVPVPLKTSDTQVVPGGPNGGGVRNFTYNPQVTAANPYGDLGIIRVTNVFGEDMVRFDDVSLTLVPVGTLADGSTGTAETVKPVKTPDGWSVTNKMYGTYTVKATMNGIPLAIRPVFTDGSTGAFDTTYTGGFIWPYWVTRPTMVLELSNRT